MSFTDVSGGINQVSEAVGQLRAQITSLHGQANAAQRQLDRMDDKMDDLNLRMAGVVRAIGDMIADSKEDRGRLAAVEIGVADYYLVRRFGLWIGGVFATVVPAGVFALLNWLSNREV